MKVISVIIALFLASLVVSAQTTPPAGSDTQPADGIYVIGVSVMAPNATNTYKLNSTPLPEGTQVHVVLVDGKRQLVGADADASKLQSFADDKGTDLMTSKVSGGYSKAGFWFSCAGRERHSYSISILSPSAPAAGAKELKLKGELAMVVGADEKEVSQDVASLAQGQKIAIGPLAGEVVAYGEHKKGDGSFWLASVSVRGDKPFDAIKSMEATGPDGKKIEISITGTQSFRMGEKGTYTISFNVLAPIKDAKFKVTYFDKLETIKVPFEKTVTLGN